MLGEKKIERPSNLWFIDHGTHRTGRMYHNIVIIINYRTINCKMFFYIFEVYSGKPIFGSKTRTHTQTDGRENIGTTPTRRRFWYTRRLCRKSPTDKHVNRAIILWQRHTNTTALERGDVRKRSRREQYAIRRGSGNGGGSGGAGGGGMRRVH